jgi:hypothetical protein
MPAAVGSSAACDCREGCAAQKDDCAQADRREFSHGCPPNIISRCSLHIAPNGHRFNPSHRARLGHRSRWPIHLPGVAARSGAGPQIHDPVIAVSPPRAVRYSAASKTASPFSLSSPETKRRIGTQLAPARREVLSDSSKATAT